MSLMDNNNGMVTPVSPMYGGGGYTRLVTEPVEEQGEADS